MPGGTSDQHERANPFACVAGRLGAAIRYSRSKLSGAHSAVKIPIVLLAYSVPFLPLAGGLLEEHPLLKVAPVPFGLLYLQLLSASALASLALFAIETIAGRSTFQRIASVLGIIPATGASLLLLAWGPLNQIFVASGGAHLLEATVESVDVFVNALALVFLGINGSSLIAAFAVWWKDRNLADSLQLFTVEFPLAISNVVLLVIATGYVVERPNHFIAAISSYMTDIAGTSLRGLPIEERLRTSLVELSKRSFFFGLAFGALVVQLTLARVAHFIVMTVYEGRRKG